MASIKGYSIERKVMSQSHGNEKKRKEKKEVAINNDNDED